MNRWRGRSRNPREPEPSISPESIAWRIGVSDQPPQDTLEQRHEGEAVSAADGQEPGVSPAHRATVGLQRPPSLRAGLSAPFAHSVVSSGTRRLVLWRDVSALLFGVVGIVLVAQFALQSGRFSEVASATDVLVPEATDVAAGGAASARGSTPQPTFGPVIDPGLIQGIEATPTPVITAPPATRRPARTSVPTLSPTLTPSPTLMATPTIDATPSPTPSPSPSPSASATPTDPPSDPPSDAPTDAPTPSP